MQSKRILALIIFVLIIIFILLIILIASNIYSKDKNEINIKNEYIKVEERNESGAPYEVSELNNFNFKIENLSSKILDMISADSAEIYVNVKEYIYLNGLVTANIGTVTGYESYNETIILLMELNDKKQTSLKIEIKLGENNEYSITSY